MARFRPFRQAHHLVIAAALGVVAAAALPAQAAPWAGNRNSFASPRFEQVWRNADLAVQQGQAPRSWTWGPQPWFDYREAYKQSPNGLRLVQYFDKARMEINDPENTSGPLAGVTNGLLTVEMVSGRLKLGDGVGPDQNEPRAPSTLPVAGDIPQLGETITTPTYASFRGVATVDNDYRDPNKVGQRVGATFNREGAIGFDQNLANQPGTEIVVYETVTGHNVPRVFDDFRNAGPVPAIAAFGYPITDPYWVTARLGGQQRPVLVQLFERRTLTYTPGNPQAFQVEMGNVGQHYFLWRYTLGRPWSMPDPEIPITFASKQEGPEFTPYQIDPTGANQQSLGGLRTSIVPTSGLRWWLPELPQHYRVVYGESTAFNGKRQLALLLPQAPARDRVLTSESNDYQPAVSPDGSQLAFVSDRDGNPDLYLIFFGPHSDRVLRLTDTRDCAVGHPSWLPDGSGLVYESNCQGGNWELYRANLSYTVDADARVSIGRLISPVSGEASRLTTNTSDDRWPRVSPDGSRIAFFSGRDGNPEIYSSSIDGSLQERLTSSNARDEAPVWSPDGTQIVFNSNRDGDHEIFIMARDGSRQTQLTNNTVDDGYAVWGP